MEVEAEDQAVLGAVAVGAVVVAAPGVALAAEQRRIGTNLTLAAVNEDEGNNDKPATIFHNAAMRTFEIKLTGDDYSRVSKQPLAKAQTNDCTSTVSNQIPLTYDK